MATKKTAAKKKAAPKKTAAKKKAVAADVKVAPAYTAWVPADMPIGGKSNSTEMLNDHPTEHNHTASAVSDIVDRFADLRLYVPGVNSCGIAGDLLVDGQNLAQYGTTAAPSYSFQANPDTGMYSLNGVDVALSADGSLALLVHPSYIYSYKPNIGVDGSLAAPTYSFQSDTDTGMFRYAANQIAFTLGGELSALHQLGGTYLYKPQRAQNGTRLEPSYSFQYDTDTGINTGMEGATGNIELVGNGKRLLQLGLTDPTRGAWMPTISTRTTTIPANVYIHTDAAQEGALYRSTASRAFMQEVEAVNLDATNSVYDLNPIWYRSTCDGDNIKHSHYGLAAEDCAAVDPRLAIMATDEEGVETADNVNTNAVIALMVSAVQEQRQQISDLTARIEALEAAG